MLSFNLSWAPMASEDASVAKIALDLHAELGPPPQKRQYTISRHEKRREEARLVFNKIIAGHYRDIGNDYSQVGALFVTWAVNDLQLNGKDSEVSLFQRPPPPPPSAFRALTKVILQVNQLRSIFEQDLNYQTDAFEIPAERPASALNRKVADFVHKYDEKNTLLVLYYAGHGFEDETSGSSGLSIAAIDEGDGEHGDPRAFFPDVMRLLHVAHSDVLLIIDCCYASKAFLSERHGRRKFELLASSMSLSPSPGKPGSFTAALIRVLKSLLGEPEHKRGFSTSILYSRLYHYPSLEKYKPLLFDQSQFDYGKIWLRPQRSPAHHEILVKPSDVALDLKIHLNLTKDDPVGLAMNELAKALQYLPHVHHIDFLQLHAGDEEVAMFLQALRRVSNVKKAIRLLKEKVKRRKREELESADPMRRIHRPPSFNQYLMKIPSSSTQDWSAGLAEFSNGTVVPVKSTPRTQNDQSYPIQPHLQSHQRRRAFWIPGILYVRYIIDITGIWFAVAQFFNKWAGRMPDQELGPSQRQADGVPTVPKNADNTSNLDCDTADSGRDWKYRRRRHLKERIAERICWLLCLGAVYMWKTGKI